MAIIKDKINDFIAWLDAKINKGSCCDCPCYAYEKNHFDGDISEYCMVSANEDIHWYCLTPYFVRRWLCKHELRKRDRFVEKMMEAEEECEKE